MNLTNYDENTARQTKIRLLPETTAKVVLLDVLTKIPAANNLSWPEGSKSHQAESMIDFIIQYHPGITPREIELAFELNQARRFEKYIEFYGKWDKTPIASLLNEYKIYRMNQQPRGMDNEVTSQNIESQIIEDCISLRTYRANYRITRNVFDKWDWLKVNRKDFDCEMDSKTLKEYEDHYRKAQSIINEKYTDPRKFAEDKHKSELIREYLVVNLI